MPFVSPIITEAAVNASQVTLVIQPLHVIKVSCFASIYFLKINDLITQNLKKDYAITVKFGNKEWFDKEQIGINEPFLLTNLPFTS